MARRGALLFWRAVNGWKRRGGHGIRSRTVWRGELVCARARGRVCSRSSRQVRVVHRWRGGRVAGAATTIPASFVISPPSGRLRREGIERAPRSVRFPLRLDWRRAADQWRTDRRNGWRLPPPRRLHFSYYNNYTAARSLCQSSRSCVCPSRGSPSPEPRAILLLHVYNIIAIAFYYIIPLQWSARAHHTLNRPGYPTVLL